MKVLESARSRRLLMLVAVAVVAGLAFLHVERGSSPASGDPTFEVLVLVVGDSLADGDWPQLDPHAAFPAQLERALHGRGLNVRVSDLAVSGARTADGLRLLETYLAGRAPDGATVAILELGSNDSLLALPPAVAEANLRRMLELLRDADIRVLLSGTYGSWPHLRGYGYRSEADARAFEAIYPRLAEAFDVPLDPYFLDGVMDDPDGLTFDGLHPNATGIGLIVARILPQVEALVREAAAADGDRGGF